VGWLVRDGGVLASCEIATSRAARRRGLLGRDHYEGAFVLSPCRHVHTARMRFAVDVALCDRTGRVLAVRTLAPWRVSPLRKDTALVIEAEAGAFDRWGLRVGDVVEYRP
jgi:uncharacterized protein